MKNAYPNFAPDSIFIKPVYNLNKWLDAMREIYSKLYLGTPFKESFGNVTSNWEIVEKKDFASWITYYQSGNQTKYKKAQFYVNDSIPGYLLPNIQRNVPPPVVPDFNEAAAEAQLSAQNVAQTAAQAAQIEKDEKKQKREMMEEQRKKIIGRLHAAIKHLTSYEGHLLVGEEFEKLLSGMYTLLQQIQTVNKVSLSNQLYYDLTIRQANRLSNDGFTRSAKFLTKFAQSTGTPTTTGVPGKMDFAQGEIPIASQSGDGVAGSLENPTPPVDALTAPPPPALTEDAALPSPPVAPKEKDPFEELLENLNTGGFTDSNFSDSTEKDELDSDITLDDDLSVEAQFAPPAQQTAPTPFPAPPMPSKPPSPGTIPQDNMEVSLPETITPSSETSNKDIDAIINSALSSISIKDIVKKIEDVNAIFQNRTIVRELSIIDLMLFNLGLSSYFNNLSEIIQKNHEASNYSISRLSDILTKLRGAISAEIDLTEQPETRSDVQQLQHKLQLDKDKDENRKEMRKQIQDNALSEELQDQTKEPTLPSQPTPTAQSAMLTPPTEPAEEVSQVPTQLIP